MKFILPILFLLLIPVSKLYSQCSDIIGSSYESCLLADSPGGVEIIHGNCNGNVFNTNLEYFQIPDLIMICNDMNSILNNSAYFAFIADGTDVFSVQVSPIEETCFPAPSGGRGIHGTLLLYGDCSGEVPIANCQTLCTVSSYTLETNFLPDSGQIIILLIDGCAGAVCDIEFEILSGWTNSPLEPYEVVIEQSTILYEGNENCSNYTLNVEPSFKGVCNYLWTLPDGSTRTSYKNSIDIEMNGIPDGLICVQGFSESCYPGELFPSENSICFTYTAREYTNIEMGSASGSCGEANGSAFVQVNGEGPFEFLWNNGVTDSILVDLEGGIYTVSVTDEYGCLYIDTAYVDTSFTIFSEIEIERPDCMELVGGITLTSSGGSGSYVYSWLPNVSSTNNAVDIEPGQYLVTVTDVNDASCFEELVIDLTTREVLNVEIIEIFHSDMFLNNGRIRFMVDASVEYEYILNSSHGMQVGSDSIIDNLAPGNYSLEIIPLSDDLCKFSFDFVIKGFNRPISFITFRDDIHIFPNPVSDILYIEGVNSECTYEIFSVAGEFIKSAVLVDNFIDLNNFTQGVYFVRIYLSNGGLSTRKVVKM